MPLYLSKKRDNPPPTKGMQVDATFERGTPSALRYIAYGRPELGFYYLQYFFAAVSRLIFASLRLKSSKVTIENVVTTWVPLKKNQMIPINNPDGALAFSHGHRPNPTALAFLTKYDAAVPTPVYRGKKQFQINILSRLQDEDIPDFLAFESSSRPITAPSDTLSPMGFKAYLDILNIVSVVASTLRHAVSLDPKSLPEVVVDIHSEEKTDPVDDYTADVISSSGAVCVESIQKEVKDADKGVVMDAVKSTLGMRKDNVTRRTWGSVDSFDHSVGLAVPYRRDYSSPDAGIITQFVSRFSTICDKSTLDDDIAGMDEYLAWIVDWWRKEVCNTTQGEWLAHMMKVMVMCMEVGCGIFVCVQNGMYLGSLMTGRGWSIQIGKEVYSATDALDPELDALDAHSASLERILDVVRVPKPRRTPTSMRELRELVIGQPLTPDDKAKISELLPALDFGALPDSVNATTVKTTTQLICDPSLIIASDLYLFHGEFWTTDRIRLILSRFGARAPTFMTGSKKYRMAPNAHGQGIQGAEPFSSNPPATFQMAIVPISKAASDWEYILKTGMANMEGVVEITGSKTVFRGQGAKDVWTTCTGYIHMAINRTLGQGATTQSLKRGQDDDMEEGEIKEDVPRAVKKAKFNPFA